VTLPTDTLRDTVGRDGSIRGLLEQRVGEYGDKTFLAGDAGRYSYRRVDEMANSVANALLRLGLSAGDRIGLMMANSAEWVAIWLGAAKVGAVTVTINTAYKGDGLAYQLGHSAVKILAVDPDLLPRVLALRDEMVVPTVFVDGDAAGTAGVVSLDELFSGSTAPPPDPGLEPRTAASILYTSGTTGPPKGCLLPNGQYLAAAHLHADNCGYGPETTLYTCLPLFHINAQNYSLLSALAAGGTLALDRKFTASRFWDRLIETGATAFNFIGSMPISLWNQPPSPAEQRHAARVAFGVPIPLPIWEAWEQRFNCRVVYAYGMTENALPAIFPLEDTPAAPHLRGAAGKASPTTEVAVVDDADDPVEAGTVGEIVTRPKIPWTMMAEYVDRPEATAAAFRNGWFHTGDLGFLDGDGFLFYVDRKKDALRRRGEMVSSWEVEATVGKFPAVAECAVVGVPSEMGEDEILVAVVPDGEPFDPADLVAFCEERMARFQVPRYVRFVAALPRTQTQRVEKYRLRAEGVTGDTWDATNRKDSP